MAAIMSGIVRLVFAVDELDFRASEFDSPAQRLAYGGITLLGDDDDLNILYGLSVLNFMVSPILLLLS